MEIKTKIKLDWHDSIRMAELLELVKDEDPEKIVIDVEFEVPDWTRLVIIVHQ